MEILLKIVLLRILTDRSGRAEPGLIVIGSVIQSCTILSSYSIYNIIKYIGIEIKYPGKKVVNCS